MMDMEGRANGLRYPRVGGRGQCLGAGKTQSQKNACKPRQNPQRLVHHERAGAHFSRQKPSSGSAKYTPKRQNDKPYKAVEACQRDIPEVHRGYRSN
jgi:hypothetical protein